MLNSPQSHLPPVTWPSVSKSFGLTAASTEWVCKRLQNSACCLVEPPDPGFCNGEVFGPKFRGVISLLNYLCYAIIIVMSRNPCPNIA